MQDTSVEKVVAEFEQLSPEQQKEFLRRIETGRADNELAEQIIPANGVETHIRKDRLPIAPRVIGVGAPVRDRSLEYEWLERHRDEYVNQWIALDGAHLVSHGADFKLGRNILGREGWLQLVRLAIIDYDEELYLSLYNDQI